MKLSNIPIRRLSVRWVACILVWAAGVTLTLAAAEIYVSLEAPPGGNGSKEAPFQSLEDARLAVRKLNGAPATVHIGPGHYVLRDGFTLSGGDSGTSGQRVSYSGDANGGTRFSSGVVVPPTALRPVTDPAILERLPEESRSLIREVSLDELGIKVTPFKETFRGIELLEVFWDGSRLPLSRWPGGGRFARVEKVTDNGIDSSSAGTFVYREDRPVRWRAAVQDGLWVRGFWRVPWVIEAVRVAAIDPGSRTITLAAPIQGGIGSKYHRAANNGVGPGSGDEPWEAFNLLEEIDTPGEWAVRFATRTLYLLPPEGEGQLLISDNRNPVISLVGVSHVTLENLAVDSGLGEGVRVEGGEGVLIAGCKVLNVARHGIVVRGGTGHTVLSCDTAETGLSGIVYSGGDRTSLTPAGHRILNNLVRRAGLFFPAPGIDAGLTIRDQPVGNLVAHNRIHDCMNSGIVYAGNENIFEFNEIYRVGLGSSDLGGFYTTGGWTSRGNIVRFNFVHHSMNANAFYVDDGDSGDTFLSNVAYRTESGGFIGGGHDQVFRNNIIIESPRAMHVDSRGVPRKYTVDDPRLRGDLDSVPYMTAPWSEKYPTLTTLLDSIPEMPSGIVIEGNLFVRCETPLRKSGKSSELERIVFENNIESDDMNHFVDPDTLDFSLKPDAAVFTEVPGFPQIPMAKIGLYPDAYRPEVPARNLEQLRTESTDRGFDSQTDVDASNKKAP
jgi:hypothetical protein